MIMGIPAASIRAQVAVPLRFPDGFATDSHVFTFEGLVDGRGEHTLNLTEGFAGWPRRLYQRSRG